jgi:hypothetical protein
MSPPSDRLNAEAKVANARLESLFEDTDTEHTVTFDALSNEEVITLGSALTLAELHFSHDDADPQAAIVHECNEELREQTSELFDELDDISEPVREEVARANSRGRGLGSTLRERLFGGSASAWFDRWQRLFRVASLLQLVSGLALIWTAFGGLDLIGVPPLVLTFVLASFLVTVSHQQSLTFLTQE